MNNNTNQNQLKPTVIKSLPKSKQDLGIFTDSKGRKNR